LEWIKEFLNWLRNMVTKLFHKPKPAKVSIKPEATLNEERTERVNPIWWRHNMPKYQPCPEGHGWKRREEKTMGGANYWCNKCRRSFLVRVA